MVKRDVKGLHKVTSKGHDYWYPWREPGAPRVHGEYGTPEFWHRTRRQSASGACRSLDASARW